MNVLEIGKLYCCEDYYLMLYPDKTTAATGAATGAKAAAAYWSREFSKPVGYAEKNIPILVLNNEEGCFEVLAGDRKGWIIFQDWLNLEEIRE